MGFLTEDELSKLDTAETSLFPSPIPVQCVSSDEFMPSRQTPKQKEYEARVKAIGSEMAKNWALLAASFSKVHRAWLPPSLP